MSKDELLSLINHGLKRTYTTDAVFAQNVDLKLIKKIDAIFNKGIYFYIDPSPIKKESNASIFFRKKSFDTKLNLRAVKVVNEFEEVKHLVSATLKLSDIKLDRKLPVFDYKTKLPFDVAQIIRRDIYPKFTTKKREFLTAIINRLANYNVFVFEFVEYHNQTEKANIDGFFIKPNVIVIKKQQSLSRELFTLAHELGHLLLNQEEVESYDYIGLDYNRLNAVEKWCNDFAYYFLIGDHHNEIEKIDIADANNDYCHDLITAVSQQTNISPISLFTHLLFTNKISRNDYNNIKDELTKIYNEQQAQKKLLNEQQGGSQHASAPKPIASPLFISSMQAAYYSGAINEYDFRGALQKTLKINNFEKYLK